MIILETERRITVQELIELLQHEDKNDLVCVETFTLPRRRAGRWYPLRQLEHDYYAPEGGEDNIPCVCLMGFGRTGEHS